MIEDKLKRLLRRNVIEVDNNRLTFDTQLYNDHFSVNTEIDFEILEFLWEKFGLPSFKKGILKLVDPSIYAEVVGQFKGVTKDAIPFARTALGCFFIWDIIDDEYVIAYLNVHNNTYEFSGDRMEDLFNYDILSDPYWDEAWNGEHERKAIEKFPQLKISECVSFLPAIPAGGEWSEESMIKVEFIEHLYILSEMHRKL